MAELLAKESLERRLKEIADLYHEDRESFNDLGQRLKEKGTEYVVVFPLFEVLLEFDPLKHISFESSSEDYNDQRFDMAINSNSKSNRQLLVEAKPLDKKLTSSDKEQLEKYLESNPEFPWGILTNGFTWWFFICADYIESVANEGETLTQKKDNVLNLMELRIDESYFCDFMKNFKHDNLEETWKKLAHYSVKIIESSGGGHPKVHDGQKDIDEYIKSKIRDKLEIQKGEYFNLIYEGTLKEGDTVTCVNEFLKVDFTLDDTGKLILTNGEIRDFKIFSENCDLDRFTNWIKENVSFESQRDFRISLDRNYEKKETQKLRDKYPFKPY